MKGDFDSEMDDCNYYPKWDGITVTDYEVLSFVATQTNVTPQFASGLT